MPVLIKRGKLLKKPDVIFSEEPQVFDLLLDHGYLLYSRAEKLSR